MAKSSTPPSPRTGPARDLDDLLRNAPPRPPQPPGQQVPRQATKGAPLNQEVGPTDQVPSAGHKMTFNLSGSNNHRMRQLSYWRRGPKANLTWILNQALTEYLDRFADSDKPVPVDEESEDGA